MRLLLHLRNKPPRAISACVHTNKHTTTIDHSLSLSRSVTHVSFGQIRHVRVPVYQDICIVGAAHNVFICQYTIQMEQKCKVCDSMLIWHVVSFTEEGMGRRGRHWVRRLLISERERERERWLRLTSNQCLFK